MGEPPRPVCSALIVDDEQAVLCAYACALKPRMVFTAGCVIEGARIARREKPELALVGLRLQNQPPAATLGVSGRRGRCRASGVDLIPVLRKQQPTIRVVLITAGRTWAYSKLARSAGAEGLLSKRLGPNTIIDIIERDLVDEHDRPPDYPMSLDRATYEYVTEIYVAEDRNIQRTAEILGITRNKLKRKLKEDFPER